MSKRRDKTAAQQLDERLGTMETKLRNLASVIDAGHAPANKEQALRVASMMRDLSAQLLRLGSSA